MIEKVCENCSVALLKRAKDSKTQWAKRRFCSLRCAGKFIEIKHRTHKVCSKCKKSKELVFFGEIRSIVNGKKYPTSRCTVCASEDGRIRYWINPEKYKLARKKSNAVNRKSILIKLKEYRIKNKKDLYKKQADWRKTPRGRFLSRQKAHRKRLRRKNAVLLGTHSLSEWSELIKRTGNLCLMCGVSGEAVMLTQDHIVPISKGGDNTIKNIQPLCRGCNSIKGIKTLCLIK